MGKRSILAGLLLACHMATLASAGRACDARRTERLLTQMMRRRLDDESSSWNNGMGLHASPCVLPSDSSDHASFRDVDDPYAGQLNEDPDTNSQAARNPNPRSAPPDQNAQAPTNRLSDSAARQAREAAREYVRLLQAETDAIY